MLLLVAMTVLVYFVSTSGIQGVHQTLYAYVLDLL
jgi:hypothetical protein